MWRTGLLIGIALGYISGQPEGKKAIIKLAKGSNDLANTMLDKAIKSLKENFPNTAKEVEEEKQEVTNVQ